MRDTKYSHNHHDFFFSVHIFMILCHGASFGIFVCAFFSPVAPDNHWNAFVWTDVDKNGDGAVACEKYDSSDRHKQIIMRMKNDPRSIKMILGFSFNFNFRKRTIFFSSISISFFFPFPIYGCMMSTFSTFLWCKFTTKLVVLNQVCLWFGIHLIRSISAFIQFYRWKQKQIVLLRQFFPDEKLHLFIL